MPESLDAKLTRWRQAGLLDEPTAQAIRRFEDTRQPAGSRWSVTVVLSAGGLMLSAGLLLFVAAHWDEVSPAGRTGMLLALLLGLHGAGAMLADRHEALATTLHAVGTAALGAAIFLAGQTYHLQSAWPRAFLLWALGAWAGVALTGRWPQVLLAALLTPAWLVAEWIDAVSWRTSQDPAVVAAGLLLLSLVYLLADGRGQRSPVRATLASAAAVGLLPVAVFTVVGVSEMRWHWDPVPGLGLRIAWWTVALLGPLLLAAALRGRDAWQAAVAAGWVILGVRLGPHPGVLSYLWAAAGALALVASGLADQSRRRINLGMGGFALTVVVFYFSSVLDKLGRATSLLLGGLLFLALGWALERTRRRLVARVTAEKSP